ncbi:MAG: polymer-forming cytoskeletal protein [Deltaproteobacteria bacterium]|nr:polymer-forming cytoskeletal protein [Deltaproteobacteria bacterium]MBW2384984.1 polymer-forming cytoskeletal protein [Deltaproteobacteria bacterium]MBW2695498.1 polymer-forming cytoskeletal protein [Deltaproteobacteria bacterium]
MSAERPPVPPLVPAGGRFVGTLAFRGQATVDGVVEGPVQGEGCLRVGPLGRIRGPVSVDELQLSGEVEGDVTTRVRVSLGGGATLRGTLETELLEVADGAVLEGSCRVGEVPGDSGSEPGSAAR